MKLIRLQSERGIVTIIALIMVAMLTLIGLAALSTSDDEASMAGNELQEMRAFYAAEAGLEAAAAALQQQWVTTGAPPTVMPSGNTDVNNCTMAFSTADDGAATQRTLSTGYPGRIARAGKVIHHDFDRGQPGNAFTRDAAAVV